MKRFHKFLTILMIVTLLCCFLSGCTPDDGKQPAGPTLPALDTGTEQVPGGNGGSDTQARPAGSDPVPSAPVSSSEPGSEQTSESVSDEDGLEVVSEYTFEVGEGVGIGGN